MKLSLFGRFGLASFAAMTLGLGMTGCGGGTVGFMWVLGQQYNQIAGFKIDDYTGNLTQIPHEPFTTNGAVPVSLVLKPGGRYLYVLNQGTGAVAPTGAVDSNGDPTTGTHAASGNVSVFSVGGDGTLTLQQTYVTQGFNSQWMQMDSTGQYLYVLDQYGPNYNRVSGGVTDLNGSITAYSVASDSGRLTLLQNTQSVAGGAKAKTFFEVGQLGGSLLQNPFQLKQAGNCLFATSGTQYIGFAFSGGQLTTTSNGVTPWTIPAFANASSAPTPTTPLVTSIAGNNSYLTVTDTNNNSIGLYTVSSTCSLTAVGGGPTYLGSATSNPVWSLIENSGKYIYIANKNNPGTATTRNSSISAYTINQSTNQLQLISGSPYGVGSGPVCMAEDPTNQYLYASGQNDGTITGKIIDNTTGILSQLSRGSTFDTGNKQLQCLAISGSVD